jgi:hypothetical protein
MEEIKNPSVERNLISSHSNKSNVEEVNKHRQVITIQYHQIEQIIESHLIKFNGLIYETVEDLQRFPDTIHLKDNPSTYDEFMDLYERLINALGGC